MLRVLSVLFPLLAVACPGQTPRRISLGTSCGSVDLSLSMYEGGQLHLRDFGRPDEDVESKLRLPCELPGGYASLHGRVDTWRIEGVLVSGRRGASGVLFLLRKQGVGEGGRWVVADMIEHPDRDYLDVTVLRGADGRDRVFLWDGVRREVLEGQMPHLAVLPARWKAVPIPEEVSIRADPNAYGLQAWDSDEGPVLRFLWNHDGRMVGSRIPPMRLEQLGYHWTYRLRDGSVSREGHHFMLAYFADEELFAGDRSVRADAPVGAHVRLLDVSGAQPIELATGQVPEGGGVTLHLPWGRSLERGHRYAVICVEYGGEAPVACERVVTRRRGVKAPQQAGR